MGCKKRFFFGLRAGSDHRTSCPVELVLASASEADIVVFKRLQLDVFAGATIYADKTYTYYGQEDLLNEDTELSLVALRKSNIKRPMQFCLPAVPFHEHGVLMRQARHALQGDTPFVSLHQRDKGRSMSGRLYVQPGLSLGIAALHGQCQGLMLRGAFALLLLRRQSICYE